MAPDVPGTRPALARRAVPLRSTCALPHHCSPSLRLQVLGHAAYFSGLTDRELRAIDRRMVSLSWAEGDPLYMAGDHADHLYVLAEGRVKLVRHTRDGSEVITDLLVPGNLFGALSSLGQPVFPESAVALTTTCALRIDATSFRSVLAEHPQVALRVLDDIAARFERTRSGIGGNTGGTVPQRVAATLLRLADTIGQDTGRRGILLQVPLSRADLAAMAGSTPESVSRAMSRLRKDQVVDSGRRWTSILDRERLRRIAQGEQRSA